MKLIISTHKLKIQTLRDISLSAFWVAYPLVYLNAGHLDKSGRQRWKIADYLSLTYLSAGHKGLGGIEGLSYAALNLDQETIGTPV